MARVGIGFALVLTSFACGSDPVPPGVAEAQACARRFAHDPPPDDGSGVQFYCSTPIFTVAEMSASLRHYESRLGFSVAWVWGDPPSFAAVRRGNVEIFLCEDCQGNPQNWVSVFVDDVDRLHEEYLRSGAKILVPPTDHEWGMREMLVEDRDGHRLRMGHGTGDED